jgi:uncharacterized protein (DUF2236 family)
MPSPPVPAAREPSHARLGLFPPDSVTWRLHADPLLGMAALRSLLLQALHPVAAQAMAEHTTYAKDPWQQLLVLVRYLGTVSYGGVDQAMLAASRVRAVHARVLGLTPDGAGYHADDPELLAWGHCCLVASILEITTRGGHRLTGAEQDGYISEQVRAAMLIGLEPGEVPHDRAGLREYFQLVRTLLECTPPARRAARVVIAPAQGPRADQPGWAGIAGLAFATLPPWARRLYALPRLTGAAALGDAAATVGLRSLRGSLRTPLGSVLRSVPDAVPPALRRGPALA